MTPLIWAALLLLLALVLAVLELFIPSGGVLGFFAAVAAGAGVFLAYYFGGLVVGTVFLAVVAAAVPALLAAAVKIWPHTPIGRAVLIPLPESDEDILPEDEERRLLQALVGRRGVAKSDMLPSGAVMIDKKTYDAVSEGVPIDRGQPVQVVAVRMHCLVVRPVETAEVEVPRSDDPLAQPIEKFGLDPLDDPLA